MGPPVYVCDFDDAITRVGLAGEDSPKNTVDLDGEIDFKSGKIDSRIQPYSRGIFQPPGLFQSSVPTDLERMYQYIEALCTLDDDADKAFDYGCLSFLFTRTPYHEGERLMGTTQTMFEYLRTPSILPLLSTQAIMYATGRPQGIAVDSRNSTTHVAAFVDGLPASVSPVLDLGSLGLTQMLAKALEGRIPEATMNSVIENPGIRNDVKLICETYQLCVAPDVKLWRDLGRVGEETSSGRKTYRLADGQTIDAGNEMFEVPEALFSPELAQVSGEGLDKMICNVVESCSHDKNELLRNVVIAGENANFDGMAERIQAEIKAKTGITSSVTKVSSAAQRAWQGGSIIACMSIFSHMAASIDEYEEFGSSLVERKGW